MRNAACRIVFFFFFVVLSTQIGQAQNISASINSSAKAPQVESSADSSLTVEILQMNLYAKTTAEKQYCEYVIEKRNEGVLPNRILYGAYRYAMKQDKDRRFTYFEMGLQKLCEESKIDLNASQARKKYFFSTKPTTAPPEATKPSFNDATKSAFSSFFKLFRRY